MLRPGLLFAALVAAAGSYAVEPGGSANAQPLPTLGTSAPNIRRIPLQKFDVPGTSFETVIAIAEISPNVAIGRHTHFGVESGYVLEGELTFMVEGQPEKILKVGESYFVPNGAVHDARTGAAGGKVIASYVVEKGKPLASPAP
jgi:quercetin dioxygenase-like cupin family protein